jgi:hypothetical protein
MKRRYQVLNARHVKCVTLGSREEKLIEGCFVASVTLECSVHDPLIGGQR